MKSGALTPFLVPTFNQISPVAAAQTRRSAWAATFVVSLFCALMPQDSHAQNTISTIAGGAFAGGPALSLDLPGPTSAVRDAAGNTYIAAPNSNYIFKLSGSAVTPFAGTGIEGYNGEGVAATSAELALVNGLTIDGQGNLYFAEYGDSRIRMVNATTGIVTTVAGSGKQCEPATAACGDGGPAKGGHSAASFNFPMAVALDSAGNVYIADAFDNRIRAVNMQSAPATLFGVTVQPGDVETIAGNGVPCSNTTSTTNPCGDGGSPLAGATLNYPQSLAFDSAGNLYIADTRDNRIRMIPPSGTTISTVAGDGSICIPTSTCGDGLMATKAHLHSPMWIFLDPSNDIYIADTNDHKIREVYTADGIQKITTVAGTGTPGHFGDGGAATSAQLNFPASVFLDNLGNLIIADTGNQRVRQVSGGNISTIAGGGMGGDSGLPTQATLANPFDVAEDSAGNLYIADTANNRIRKVTMPPPPALPTISTVAGTGFAGYSGDTALATGATLNGPTGVRVDSSGNIWIADEGNDVIRRVDGSTQVITTYAGMYGFSCVRTDNCGDGGPATDATFTTPRSVALDAAGNLYIADYDAHRVREVEAATGDITTIAGTGVAGKKCPSGDLATACHLDHPSSVAVDSQGNVYIDDSYNNQIRCVNCTGPGLLSPYALNGAYTLGGDGGPALDASMWNPLAVALDPAGNLFIGGGNYKLVRRVDGLANPPTIGTVAGDVADHGEGGFTGDGGPATQAKISNIGMAVDAQQNLYVADASNNRIRYVHLTPAVNILNPPANFGAWPIKSPSAPQTFTISSAGGVDLSLTGLIFGGSDPNDFSETDTCGGLPAFLGVDTTCSVTVTFTPLNYGKRSATLLVTDNGPNSPQSVFLNGFGPYFTVTGSPRTLSIPAGSQGDTTLTVTPFGQFNKTVNLTSSGCPPDSTCTLGSQSVTLDGTDSEPVTFTITTSADTPLQSYNVVVTGEFGAQNQLQWAVPIQVNVTTPPGSP